MEDMVRYTITLTLDSAFSEEEIVDIINRELGLHDELENVMIQSINENG